MIDPSIITRGAERAQMQQQQNFESLGELGNSIGRMVLGRRINTLQQFGTPEEKKAYANKSIYAPQLNAQIKADNAAALQAQMVQQKHAADIGNTNAQAAERNSNVGKNIQQGVGYGLDNSGKLLAAADKALMYAAQSGDPMAAKLALNNAYKAGSITPELYQQYSNQIDVLGNNPDELKNFAGNLIFAGAKDPASLLYQDANNAATNATAQRGQDISSQTTMRGQDISAETSRYSTDVGANTAAAKLSQDGQQFGQTLELNQQKQYFEQNKPLEFKTGNDGFTYAVYANGKGVKVIGENGQPIKGQSKTAETPEQKITRIDNVIGSADSARSAARAATDAAKLINHPGLNTGTGATSLLGLVPGTDAKDFQVQLENLKSQVFLPTVKALQGMGALSNAEGEKIAAAVANLDTKQGPEAMKKQLTILAQQMNQAAQIANRKTQNYASRGGTIPIQSQRQPQAEQQGGDKPPIASFFE